jgi:hypothetical protein
MKTLAIALAVVGVTGTHAHAEDLNKILADATARGHAIGELSKRFVPCVKYQIAQAILAARTGQVPHAINPNWGSDLMQYAGQLVFTKCQLDYDDALKPYVSDAKERNAEFGFVQLLAVEQMLLDGK